MVALEEVLTNLSAAVALFGAGLLAASSAVTVKLVAVQTAFSRSSPFLSKLLKLPNPPHGLLIYPLVVISPKASDRWRTAPVLSWICSRSAVWLAAPLTVAATVPAAPAVVLKAPPATLKVLPLVTVV